MTIDLPAIGKGFVTYWLVSLPFYVQWGATLPEFLAPTIYWLPYLAAFLAGLVFAHVSASNKDRDCIFLGLAIGTSAGLLNLALPVLGGHTDLPGPEYSFFIGIFATIVSTALALAGAGARDFFHAKQPRG